MPNAYIKKLSGEGKGSIETLEKKWAEAKKRASEEGKSNNYAYIMSIFQNMVGASVSKVEVVAFLDQVDAYQELAAALSANEKAAKEKVSAIAAKMLIKHLRALPEMDIKGLHVTHSWAAKPMRNYADPREAFTVLIPMKAPRCSMRSLLNLRKQINVLFKEPGDPVVHSTSEGMLVAVGFTTDLKKMLLVEDLFS